MVLIRLFMVLMLAMTSLQPMQVHAASPIGGAGGDLHCAESSLIETTGHETSHEAGYEADHESHTHTVHAGSDCCMVVCCPGHTLAVYNETYVAYFHAIAFPSAELKFITHKPEAITPPPKVSVFQSIYAGSLFGRAS